MEEKINYGDTSLSKEDEIDLLKLIKILWEKRKII
jgi:LPS O-antigen subunit length determinant protein (WzzB/FepE family)